MAGLLTLSADTQIFIVPHGNMSYVDGETDVTSFTLCTEKVSVKDMNSFIKVSEGVGDYP